MFNSSGYLEETNSSPETKYAAKNELELNAVRFRSESFGRIFINLGDIEKQLTYISFWNWYWNDIGLIFILPLIGIILLLPWMIVLFSKQTHNKSVFYRTKHKKWYFADVNFYYYVTNLQGDIMPILFTFRFIRNVIFLFCYKKWSKIH